MTITGDYLFIGLIAIALVLMGFQFKRRDLLLALAISMIWFSIGMWLFFSPSAPLTITESWEKILVWVIFGVLVIAPWIWQMNTEIIREAGGKRWVDYGPTPKEDKLSSREAYREQLRRRRR